MEMENIGASMDGYQVVHLFERDAKTGERRSVGFGIISPSGALLADRYPTALEVSTAARRAADGDEPPPPSVVAVTGSRRRGPGRR